MKSWSLPVIYVLLIASAVSAVAEPVVIEGVGSIGWDAKRYSHYVAALQVVLEALGCPMEYEELMVASGAAFRTAWQPGKGRYRARTAAPRDYVADAAAAAGAKAIRRSFWSEEEAWEAVCASIDAGRPVIASRDSAADVIAGYDRDGRQAYVSTSQTSTSGYEMLPFEVSRGPTKAANELIFVEYDPATPLPELDWPTILSRAVRFADWPVGQKVHEEFVFGLAAYDELTKMLRQKRARGGAWETYTIARVIRDARAAASVVLARHATVHEGFGEAARHYKTEAELLVDMPNVLSKGHRGPWNEVTAAITASFKEEAVRERAAELIDLAKAEELLAVEALRTVVNDLFADRPADTGADATMGSERTAGQPDEAKRHYQEGLRLKGARKWREAAAELRAATVADPQHVEAHWALGWVLVELDDRDGAASAFRKVIELAPGSDHAGEAQRALERLGQ